MPFGNPAMAVFNSALNNNAPNNTSNLLHKHIFTNAFAGLPVTLFIGKIPLDFEDAKLGRMLEVIYCALCLRTPEMWLLLLRRLAAR